MAETGVNKTEAMTEMLLILISEETPPTLSKSSLEPPDHVGWVDSFGFVDGFVWRAGGVGFLDACEPQFGASFD